MKLTTSMHESLHPHENIDSKHYDVYNDDKKIVVNVNAATSIVVCKRSRMKVLPI